MNKDDVLRVAGEPVAWLLRNWRGYEDDATDSETTAHIAKTRGADVSSLYTEAQLLAMYAKGAEDMRERAKSTCAASKDTGDDRGIERDVFIWNRATTYCYNAIRALPITPTNTEGEQG